MSFPRLVLATLAAPLLLLAALHSRPAAAETLTCTQINSLPTTISAPGHYCINAHFAAVFTTAAVNINSSNVVFDCNDHVITQAGTAAVSGFYVNNKSQVTIRNCVVVGFGRGISYFETLAGYSKNNRVANNDVRKSKIVGIQMAGSANVVENNHVSENQGASGNQYTYGILLSSYGDSGVGNVIRKNVITDIAPSLYVRVTGIYLLDVDNTAVIDNTISALFPPLDLGVYGIVGSSTVLGTAAVNNHILSSIGNPPGGGGGISYGGASYDGILFDADTSASTHNVCRGNVVGHFVSNITAESALAGCYKDGNTEF
jgi:parallel beta-helix repeat protein